jgi:REP element-mobilizing transposase RayT
MEKKEAYRHILPHYQQPGQAYFVTICLWNAVAHNALSHYTHHLHELRLHIEYRKRHHLFDAMLTALDDDYHHTRRQYIYAYDQLMAQNTDRTIDLNSREISEIIIEGLTYWADTHLENQAWCIMPNHVHWVFTTREKDKEGKPVYLSTIMESVKKNTARKINKIIGREGHLWQKESFDTTIRDYKHLYRAMEYTINNPVAAKFVKDRKEWPGSWGSCGL